MFVFVCKKMKKTKLFSYLQNESSISPPNLIEVQLNSYKWFVEKGLKDLFREAPLRAKLRLENKKTGEIKEQEIYMGDFPIMTDRGTFIVNGVERVIISQIVRSPGAFLTSEFQKGKKCFGAKIIPNRGAWIELETDADDSIYVRIDRKRKLPVTVLLKIFGFVDHNDILDAFKEDDKYIKATLAKDITKTRDEGYIEMYKRIRPGDLATVDNAKQLVNTMFFSQAR